MHARSALLLCVVVLGVAGCSPRGCSRARAKIRGESPATTTALRPATRPSEGQVLVVPLVSDPVKLDGELTETAWRAAVRTGAFRDPAGAEAIPYSDARFVRDASSLYIGLYAADEEMRATVTTHDGPVWLDDAFSMRFLPKLGETRWIDVSVSGVIMDLSESPRGRDVKWESHLVVAVERDGTLNDPKDDDEEWVVEGKLPLAVFEGEKRVPVTLSRCDTPKRAKRRCGSVTVTLALD